MKLSIIAGAALLLCATPAFAQRDAADNAPNRLAPPTPQAAAEATKATAGPEATVYNNALGPGWENRSTAAVELSIGDGARKPIRVEAKGWQALQLHHAPFSAAPYRGLSMLLQTAGGEAEVRVVAVVDGKPIPDASKPPVNGEPTPKMKLVKVKPGGWTKVVVSLVDLGAKDKTIDGIWVQNNSAADAPVFYVADVALER